MARGVPKLADQRTGQFARFPILQADPHLRLGAGEDVGLLPARRRHRHQRRKRALLDCLGWIGGVRLGGPGRQPAGLGIDILDVRFDFDVVDLDMDRVLNVAGFPIVRRDAVDAQRPDPGCRHFECRALPVAGRVGADVPRQVRTAHLVAAPTVGKSQLQGVAAVADLVAKRQRLGVAGKPKRNDGDGREMLKAGTGKNRVDLQTSGRADIRRRVPDQRRLPLSVAPWIRHPGTLLEIFGHLAHRARTAPPQRRQLHRTRASRAIRRRK